MATVYIKLHNPLIGTLSLSKNLLGSHCEIQYLKATAPDDGEAISHQGRYALICRDEEWQDVVEKLKESGESLVYTVVSKGKDGKANIAEAGELNSDVLHYTTRSSNRTRIFAIWFQDCLPERQLRLAA